MDLSFTKKRGGDGDVRRLNAFVGRLSQHCSIKGGSNIAKGDPLGVPSSTPADGWVVLGNSVLKHCSVSLSIRASSAIGSSTLRRLHTGAARRWLGSTSSGCC